jgi:putative ABC transport system ATP-binding protein
MKNGCAISLQRVSKSFQVKNQEMTILHGINLEIFEGDFAIVFGPSGCGKSTMLHVILGLEEPTDGQARFFDWNLYGYTEDDRSEFRKKNVGMIYQQPNWIKSLTVVENVAFALSLIGVDKPKALLKALESLKIVGLSDWAEYIPSELSSGQQQKVALARALVTNPKVIIADEPAGNLDYQSGIELMELFRKLNEQGTTIIMVTHNVDNVDYAKSVIQMFNGRIITIFDTSQQSAASIKKALVDRIFLHADPNKNQITSRKNLLKKKESSNWFHPFLTVFRLKKTIPLVIREIVQVARFVVLLLLYLGKKMFDAVLGVRIIPVQIKKTVVTRIDSWYMRAITLFEVADASTISRVDLIDLSLKNMISKRTRTAITVGGMAIGVATIVFLISIGYGLEKLVISRVARLEEMRQIDTSPAVSTNIKLDDKAVASFDNLAGVDKVLPVAGVVGKISYQNSNTDVAVYGVLSDYLKESAIRPSEGTIFSSNELTSSLSTVETTGQVAGASTQVVSTQAAYDQKITDVTYTIYPEEYVRVRDTPNTTGKVLGYTRRVEGTSDAEEYWGGSYSDTKSGSITTDSEGKPLGLWLKADVLLWDKVVNDDGSTVYKKKEDDTGKQLRDIGYFAELNMKIERAIELDTVLETTGSVLGESTTNGETASDSAFIDIASLEETASVSAVAQTKQITLPNTVTREAVVNESLLRVLGIATKEGVGKTFSISFIATGELLSDGHKVESAPIDYTIVGVTPDSKTPILYVPLKDVKLLGIHNYSQAKIVVDSQDILTPTRKQIELLGFKTASVIDTVSQIENLFATLRFLLGILGVVALAVAALGMLNTLTVSLLERTREVGMMKAIGMKSQEVENLYLTESMIMGILGGIGGLVIGYTFGKILSFALSTFAISKGYGYLDVTFIPFQFVLLIFAISVIVGLLTGIYPAKRATKISALDALRYE